jgi:hypothetical protein
MAPAARYGKGSQWQRSLQLLEDKPRQESEEKP